MLIGLSVSFVSSNSDIGSQLRELVLRRQKTICVILTWWSSAPRNLLMKEVFSNWNYFYLKNIQWLLPRFDFLPRYIILTLISSVGFALIFWKTSGVLLSRFELFFWAFKHFLAHQIRTIPFLRTLLSIGKLTRPKPLKQQRNGPVCMRVVRKRNGGNLFFSQITILQMYCYLTVNLKEKLEDWWYAWKGWSLMFLKITPGYWMQLFSLFGILILVPVTECLD